MDVHTSQIWQDVFRKEQKHTRSYSTGCLGSTQGTANSRACTWTGPLNRYGELRSSPSLSSDMLSPLSDGGGSGRLRNSSLAGGMSPSGSKRRRSLLDRGVSSSVSDWRLDPRTACPPLYSQSGILNVMGRSSSAVAGTHRPPSLQGSLIGASQAPGHYESLWVESECSTRPPSAAGSSASSPKGATSLKAALKYDPRHFRSQISCL